MRRAAAALLALCVLLISSGCSKQADGGTLRFDLARAPETIDPQFAASGSSLMVVVNAFEGLTRRTPAGEIQPACAERWDVSPDGKTYTFTLREGLQWADGSPLLAEDFVFAFRRIFQADAPAPGADSFAGIQNSAAVRAGKQPPDSLGVHAPDVRHIVFSLDQANPAFPALLSQSAAMPCSQQFFTEQKGRYGLSAEHILCNGPFTVSAWGTASLTLSKNAAHRAPPSPDRVELYFSRGDPVDLFLADRSDVCVVPDRRLGDVPNGGDNLVYDRSWTLVVNPNREIGQDYALRRALLGAVNVQEMIGRLPKELLPAQGIVPPSAALLNGNYRALAGPTAAPPTVSDPRGDFFRALEDKGWEKLPKISLLVSDFSPGAELGGAMQRSWQQLLSAHINMEQLSYTELLSRVENGTFDLALLPMTALRSDPSEYLSRFSTYSLSVLAPTVGDRSAESEPSPPEKAPTGSPTIGSLLERARRQSNPADAAQAFLAVEQQLIDGYAVLPIYDAPSLLAQRKGVTGAVYTATSQVVYFADAKCIS